MKSKENKSQDKSLEELNSEFDQSAEEMEQSSESESDQSDVYMFHTPLGDLIQLKFEEAERDRRDIEQRWLRDLRQYRGEYDPEIKEKLHPKRSKAYFSLTRPKVRTVTSRMTDLLFPANGERNWGITPTPMPELNPIVIQNIATQYLQATEQAASEEMIRKFINDEAVKRCTAMEKEIEDQLTELKYRAMIRDTINSGNLFGTGILKGPLVKEITVKRWLPTSDGKWVIVEIPKLLPWVEFVPIWDIYPDMTARTPEGMRYIFQRYIMPRAKVAQLATRADFNGEIINAYLTWNKNGNATYRQHETDLQLLNIPGTEGTGFKETTSAGTSYIGGQGTGIVSQRTGKYELIEFWGYLNTEDLIDLGVKVPEEKRGLEVAANIWLLDGLIIKAVISQVEGVTFPYHFYYYDKDDTSIFGEGIPSIMRYVQRMYNAGVRAMIDNAAISAGPIIEANVDLLDIAEGEDPRDIYPFRVYLRSGFGAEAQTEAIRVSKLPSYTTEFMSMLNFFQANADEITTAPRYLYGETNQVSGAGRTATGLSMLMGATNVTLKDQIKNFDDGVTVPFIRSMYFWNMDFNDKEFIKGDYSVTAKGSTSLIAREVRAESLASFLNVTNNPTDLLYQKRDNVLRQMVKVLDLDDLDLIKDANTVFLEQEKRDKRAEEDRKFVREIALIKAKSGGHMSASATTPGLPDVEQLSQDELMQGKIPQIKDVTV